MCQELKYEEINIGDKASFSKTISEFDVYSYAGISGDFNPVHINAIEAAHSIFEQRVAHGMLSAGLISAVLGNKLPGPGTIYLGQDLSFKSPVFFGDTLTAECEVTEKNDSKHIIKLSTIVKNQNGKAVIVGTATVKK